MMVTDKNSAALPPILEPGGLIRFTSIEQLAVTYTRELAEGRLSALDLVQSKLFERDSYVLVVSAEHPRIELQGMVVHRQGDVVGLQLELGEAAVARLSELVGRPGAGFASATETPVQPTTHAPHSAQASPPVEADALRGRRRPAIPGLRAAARASMCW